MAKQKKTPRPRAETPKGFRDYFGADVLARQEMLRACSLAMRSEGMSTAMSTAMMAMTTSSSMRVKPFFFFI